MRNENAFLHKYNTLNKRFKVQNNFPVKIKNLGISLKVDTLIENSDNDKFENSEGRRLKMEIFIINFEKADC